MKKVQFSEEGKKERTGFTPERKNERTGFTPERKKERTGFTPERNSERTGFERSSEYVEESNEDQDGFFSHLEKNEPDSANSTPTLA